MGADFHRLRLWVYGPKKTNCNETQADYSTTGQSFSDSPINQCAADEWQRPDAFGGESPRRPDPNLKGDDLDAAPSQSRVGVEILAEFTICAATWNPPLANLPVSSALPSDLLACTSAARNRAPRLSGGFSHSIGLNTRCAPSKSACRRCGSAGRRRRS